jgi:hypothetical protein
VTLHEAEKWLDDLAKALQRTSGEKGAEAAQVAALFKRIARKPRPRRREERMRLLQAIADADKDYLNAQAEGSHQAADRSRRHKAELEKELARLDKPKPSRPQCSPTAPSASRVEFLEAHLAEIEADMAHLRSTEQWSLIPPLDTRACALRGELDEARAKSADGPTLDRSPAAVARELQKHAALLSIMSRAAYEEQPRTPLELVELVLRRVDASIDVPKGTFDNDVDSFGVRVRMRVEVPPNEAWLRVGTEVVQRVPVPCPNNHGEGARTGLT